VQFGPNNVRVRSSTARATLVNIPHLLHQRTWGKCSFFPYSLTNAVLVVVTFAINVAEPASFAVPHHLCQGDGPSSPPGPGPCMLTCPAPSFLPLACPCFHSSHFAPHSPPQIIHAPPVFTACRLALLFPDPCKSVLYYYYCKTE
jgi:hypothetical protein